MLKGVIWLVLNSKTKRFTVCLKGSHRACKKRQWIIFKTQMSQKIIKMKILCCCVIFTAFPPYAFQKCCSYFDRYLHETKRFTPQHWSHNILLSDVAESRHEQSSNSLLIHSEVTIFYFFKCHSCILGKGVGWAVVSTILITLELFYSTKRIQRVAVSPHWTTKVINRAINVRGQIGGNKIQEMTKTK